MAAATGRTVFNQAGTAETSPVRPLLAILKVSENCGDHDSS